jgi:colicin import membrane protein
VNESVVARWRPLGLSLAVHLGIVLLLGSGWWLMRSEPPAAQVLAIEAVVVDPQSLQALGSPAFAPAAPAPPRPAAVPDTPPAVLPTLPPKLPPKAEPEAAAKPAPAPQPAAKPSAAERAAADAKRREEQAQRKADEQRRAEAKQQAAEREKADRARLAEQQKAAEDARLRAEREADLRRQLEAEERGAAARSSGQAAQWAAAIQGRIQRAWIRPASARAGLDCTVAVTQVPGGEVVAVRVLACNGDDTVRQSIEAAVLRASPLPVPPDPSLFERNIEVRFKPND